MVPASFRLSGSVGLLPVLFIASEFRKSLSETSSPTPCPRLFNRRRAVVSLFWKIQWEKEAVSSALTSALSLCQESGWPGRGVAWGRVGRKPAAGGPCDVRLPHGSQGRGLEGEEQGSLETRAGAHAHTRTGSHLPLVPGPPPHTGSHGHGVRPTLVQD